MIVVESLAGCSIVLICTCCFWLPVRSDNSCPFLLRVGCGSTGLIKAGCGDDWETIGLIADSCDKGCVFSVFIVGFCSIDELI